MAFPTSKQIFFFFQMLLKEYVIVTLQALKDFWGCSEKGKLHSWERKVNSLSDKNLQFLLNSHNQEEKADLCMSKLHLSSGSETVHPLVCL